MTVALHHNFIAYPALPFLCPPAAAGGYYSTTGADKSILIRIKDE